MARSVGIFMHRIVIIGGVAGGASCAARLRRLDEQASIVVLERGEFVSYANCGLPYYVGGTIRSREALLLQTPEALRAKFAIDVRTRNEVVLIDRQAKTVRVRAVDGRTYDEPYDTLVIATGSSPVRPPIPGIDSPRIRTVWTVDDAVGLKALARRERERTPMGSAVIVGGGFIGLEAAENLVAAGLDVSLVEATDQVMHAFRAAAQRMPVLGPFEILAGGATVLFLEPLQDRPRHRIGPSL